MGRIIELFVSWTKLKFRIHSQQKRIFFKEREIWWASLGMNVGYEQNGKHETFERPVLVIKKFNNDLLWILPMTRKKKEGIYYVETMYKERYSYIILSQLRTISAKRLLRKVRTLPEKEFKQIRRKIKKFL